MASKPKIVDRDRGWRALFKTVEALRGDAYAKVGIVGDGASETDGGELTVAEIGAVHEYGSSKIPQRSFLRSTFDIEREKLAQLARTGLYQVLDGKASVGEVLGTMGMYLAAASKRHITEGAGIAPPNAPSTRLAKAKRGKNAKLFQAQSPWASIGAAAKIEAARQKAFRRGVHTLGQALAKIGRLEAMADRARKKEQGKALGRALAQVGALASVRPLVDTGRLLGAITWSVVTGNFGRGVAEK